jgi:hypothetical protein
MKIFIVRNQTSLDLDGNGENDFIDIQNMIIHGNETINVVSLQRILTQLSDIQTKLIPN